MPRGRVHMKKSMLSQGEREALPASAFVFPRERRFPIHDEFHGRLALIYAMSPSHSENREAVVRAVLRRYPELRSFWSSRMERVERRRLRPAAKRAVARPAARRPVTSTARRRARATTNPHEDSMPIYVLNPHLSDMRENPLAYDRTPVIVVGKPRHRLLRARTPGKPGRRSERLTIPSSETHALNPETGAAFCRAGISRKTKKVVPGMIHPTDKKVVTCMRCIKIVLMNETDRLTPGVSRKGRAIVERELKPSSPTKREQHKMIKGGDQGIWVSGSGKYVSTREPFRIHRQRTVETGGPLFRGTEAIADFEKYAGYRGRPTQTIGEKRGARIEAERTAAERRRLDLAAERRREAGLEERLALMDEFGPGMEFEEMEEVREAAARRRAASARGRMGAAARRAAEAEREAGRRAVAAGAAAARRGAGSAEEYMDNPRRRKKSRVAQAAGLKKGQSLMQKAAAAYRAGKYPTMQAALRGVARKNPLSEDGMVVNPRRKGGSGSVSLDQREGKFHVVVEVDNINSLGSVRRGLKKYANWVPGEGPKETVTRYSMSRPEAEAFAKQMSDALGFPLLGSFGRISTFRSYEKAGRARPFAADEYMDNPRGKDGKSSKRRGGRTAAQSDAARAMSLFRSGKADTLAEAWSMVKRGR